MRRHQDCLPLPLKAPSGIKGTAPKADFGFSIKMGTSWGQDLSLPISGSLAWGSGSKCQVGLSGALHPGRPAWGPCTHVLGPLCPFPALLQRSGSFMTPQTDCSHSSTWPGPWSFRLSPDHVPTYSSSFPSDWGLPECRSQI